MIFLDPVRVVCSIPSVSNAPAAPVEAFQPKPNRAMPARIGQVLGLLRTLIAYGKNLADTLQRHAADPEVLPCFAFVASIFSTSNVSLILARITGGLLRAAALEERLRKRAARGRDLEPRGFRPPSPRKPGDARRASKRRPAQDPSFARLPTPEEVAAEIRHPPIGAVLVDICLDLGIVPEQMDRETWEELIGDLFLYGGKLLTLLNRRESKFQRELRQHRGDPVGSLTGTPGFIHVPDQPIIAFPPWPVPSPQQPPPLAEGDWGRGPGP
jgi:hypothetical protein